MAEHREGRFCPEDCMNPGDAKYARSNHRAERRIQRMPAAAQNARRYFIQIAQRLKEQHAQNPHACALNDRSIRRKKPRERISEQDNRKKRNRTAKQRQAQTQPQNAPASPEFPGGVVLTDKGRRRLTERGNDVIGNVFKIHGYGHERDLLAEALLHLRGDLSDDARKQGYLSCLQEYRGSFPKALEKLSAALKNPTFRKNLSDEYAAFWTAYEQDKDLLRFHYHKLWKIRNRLKDLSLPRCELSDGMTEVPSVAQFITEDESSHNQ